jgi:nuclease S1
VVDKINEFRSVVNDKSKSVEDRRFALRFLIHCIEDMHQPCHVGDNSDKGGNQTQVRFFDRGTNMHALWDTGMIERFSRSEDEWLKELTVLASPQSEESTSEGTVEDWATESLWTARTAYQDPTTGNRIVSGTKLGQEYYDANLPVVRQRLAQAGLRLAVVLNDVFPKE